MFYDTPIAGSLGAAADVVLGATGGSIGSAIGAAIGVMAGWIVDIVVFDHIDLSGD